MSAIPFEFATVADFNALSPCCCPAAECPAPVFAYQFRDSETCKGGWSPWLKDDDRPDGFDMEKPGKLVPLYKEQKESETIEKSGNLSETWKNSSGGVVTDTFVFTAAVAYSFTTSQQSAYGKRLEEWEAGSQPFGGCPPESTVMAATATASGVSLGEVDEDGNVTVTLSTPENRPEDPGNPGEKAGFYQFRVDGFTYGASGNELEITMQADDDSCHEFQVRHVCGGNGKWSEPKVFTVKANPCCEDPEPLSCFTFTTGNVQWSNSAEYLANGGGTWTTSYTSGGSDSGTFSSCDGTEPDSSPPGFQFRPAIDGLLGSSEGYETTATYTPSKRTVIVRTSRDDSESNPIDPGDDPPGWQVTSLTDSGTVTVTDTLEWTNDQNQGKSSINRMFAELLGTAQRLGSTYGWGLELPGFGIGSNIGGVIARAIGEYPETDGFTALGYLRVRLRQFRYRWEVPESHDGDFYRVRWNIGKFHDRWVAWVPEYYEWAVAKHAFLTKPKPSDPSYPKRKDFPDAESYNAAVAAINAIEDPGAAPEEPTELRPSIVESPSPWEWKSSQAQREPENIDRCDPTKDEREPPRPEPPDRDNYPDSEDFNEAMDDYREALEEWESDREKERQRSKRQSDWWIVTPDEWSDWRGEPDPIPDLPEDPTEEDREVHERRKRQFSFLTTRWNNERHCSLTVCNVRRSCGDPPEGTIEEWDLAFPVTELPPLNPGKEDPARWASWYGIFS